MFTRGQMGDPVPQSGGPSVRGPRGGAPSVGDALLAIVPVWMAYSLGVSRLYAPGVQRLFSRVEIDWAASLLVALAGGAAPPLRAV